MILYAPDTSFAGSDTCYYLICDDGTPVKCDTGMVVFTVQGINHAPNAVNDANTTLQPGTGYFNVGTNDSDPDGNNFCLTLVYGSAAFSIAPTGNCTTIAFAPDSIFTGNDTCWYVICDNGTPQLCDTAMYVVTVNANPALLPVASFAVDFSNISCTKFTTFNTSVGDTGTAVWLFKPQFTGDSTYLYGDTAYYLNLNMWGFYGEVCLYVSNQFGKDTFCDNFNYICEGLNEAQLGNINLYPNPAITTVTIDMRNNNAGISTDYSAIEIYNAVGQKVRQLGQQGKLVSITIADLPQGFYTATIVDKQNSRLSLGKFSINH